VVSDPVLFAERGSKAFLTLNEAIMTQPSSQIQLFDPRTAGYNEFSALNNFENRIRAEQTPDDSPVALEEEVQNLQIIPAYLDVHRWLIWGADGSTIIARAVAEIGNLTLGRNMLDFHIAVLPECWRQGFGRALLAPIARLAQQEGRSSLVTTVLDHIAEAAAFLRSIGARPALSKRMSRLQMANVDYALLHRWQSAVEECSSGFSLIFWANACPEQYLYEMAQLYATTANTMPHDHLDVQEVHIIPQQVRQHEQYLAGTGTTRWTLLAVAQQSEKLAGFTEIFWSSEQPGKARQGYTCVLPEYRNQGLARGLKATMLMKIIRELPEVRVVQARNAYSNASMLQINDELGFVPYRSQVIWQVPTGQAANGLRSMV
jgi:mycothiol synthase